MSFSNHIGPRSDAKTDVVGDRNHFIQVGMAAVGFALLVFAVQRLVVTLQTGLPTPWWGNAAGLVAMTALWAWYRRGPQTRSSGAAHGTALIATITLLIPVAYGLTSTIWWLSLVGFAAVLLGRRQEAIVWGVTIPLVMVASVIVEPYVQVQGAAGELPLELALAKIVFVVILIGMTVGFRRVAEQRALVLHDSEAKSAEALVKNQDLLIQAERLGKVGGWEFDIETRLQTWTETVYEIHELDSTGHPTVDQGIDYFTPASKPIIEGAVKRAIEQGEPFDVELEIITAKGNLRSVHAIGKADMEHRRVFGFFQDITERKQAEEALAESEKKFHALFETMSEGIVYEDHDGKIISANPAAERLLGLSLDQLQGRTSVDPRWKAIHADGSPFPGETHSLHVAATTGKPALGEVMGIYNPKSDFYVWLSVNSTPEFLPGEKKPFRAYAVFRDITERKKAEQALRESEALLQTAVNILPVGLWIINAEGKIVTSSAAAQRIWAGVHYIGIDQLGEYKGWRTDSGKLIEAHEWAGARALEKGETSIEEEVEIECFDGTHKIILDSAVPLRESDGSISGAITINQDITERKQAEQDLLQSRKAALNMMTDAVEARDRAELLSKELQGHKDHLEQMVAERTVELKRQSAQLESTNKELEAFSYSVSHDLRAPLRGIDGWSLALLEDYGSQLEGQAKTYLERVRSETQRMGQLIDDLLQLSRLTTSEMSTQRVDLSTIAATIFAQLQKEQPERQVEFVLQPGLNANGDARLLEVALTNLLDNAFKFTGKTPQARIQFGQTEIDGKSAYFVRDNGVGFEMALAKKLFGAFQRMHKASDFPGTGVGLTTVQRIVHRHGGRIWAQAVVDQGATFYFSLEEIP
jgi:PAS domain S-box-containing protein